MREVGGREDGAMFQIAREAAVRREKGWKTLYQNMTQHIHTTLLFQCMATGLSLYGCSKATRDIRNDSPTGLDTGP
jgi:DNA-binding phage protein